MGSCIVCSVLSIQEELRVEVALFHSKFLWLSTYLGQIHLKAVSQNLV